MSPMTFQSKVATSLASAENEIKVILFKAARHLADAGNELHLELASGEHAVVNGFNGVIKVAGAPYNGLLHLLGILKAAEVKVAEGPAKVEAAVSADVVKVEALPSEAEHAVSSEAQHLVAPEVAAFEHAEAVLEKVKDDLTH